jgi:hypothetical protein
MCETALGAVMGPMATHTAGHCRGADDPDPARPHPPDRRGPDASPSSGPPLRPGPPLPPGPPRPALPPTAAGRPPEPWPYAVHLTGTDSPREPREIFVPVLCSVLCAPLLAIGALFFMLSPLATDSCEPDGCHALFRAMEVDPCVLALAAVLLAGCWAVPNRWHAVRPLLGVGALAAALTGVYLYVHLPLPN